MQPEIRTTEERQPNAPSTWRRKLRIGMALVCLALCFASIAIWLESYQTQGVVTAPLSNARDTRAVSQQGRVHLISVDVEGFGLDPSRGFIWPGGGFNFVMGEREVVFIPIGDILGGGQAPALLPTDLGFGVGTGPISRVSAPHWFFALVFGTLALLLKPKPRLRFGLSELLVVVTLAAAALGGVEALSRALSPERPRIDISGEMIAAIGPVGSMFHSMQPANTARLD